METVERVRHILEELTQPLFVDSPFFNGKVQKESSSTVLNFKGFVERIMTFKPEDWGVDPNAALYLAKYGWVNTVRLNVKCKVCYSVMDCECFLKKPDVLRVIAKRGHKNSCRWICLSTPELYFKIPRSPCKSFEILKLAWGDLNSMGSLLPLVPKETLKVLDISEEFIESVFKYFEHSVTDAGVSALVLALCGWVRDSEKCVKCNFCKRIIGLWNFHSVDGEIIDSEESVGGSKVRKSVLEVLYSEIRSNMAQSQGIVPAKEEPNAAEELLDKCGLMISEEPLPLDINDTSSCDSFRESEEPYCWNKTFLHNRLIQNRKKYAIKRLTVDKRRRPLMKLRLEEIIERYKIQEMVVDGVSDGRIVSVVGRDSISSDFLKFLTAGGHHIHVEKNSDCVDDTVPQTGKFEKQENDDDDDDDDDDEHVIDTELPRKHHINHTDDLQHKLWQEQTPNGIIKKCDTIYGEKRGVGINDITILSTKTEVKKSNNELNHILSGEKVQNNNSLLKSIPPDSPCLGVKTNNRIINSENKQNHISPGLASKSDTEKNKEKSPTASELSNKKVQTLMEVDMDVPAPNSKQTSCDDSSDSNGTAATTTSASTSSSLDSASIDSKESLLGSPNVTLSEQAIRLMIPNTDSKQENISLPNHVANSLNATTEDVNHILTEDKKEAESDDSGTDNKTISDFDDTPMFQNGIITNVCSLRDKVEQNGSSGVESFSDTISDRSENDSSRLKKTGEKDTSMDQSIDEDFPEKSVTDTYMTDESSRKESDSSKSEEIKLKVQEETKHLSEKTKSSINNCLKNNVCGHIDMTIVNNQSSTNTSKTSSSQNNQNTENDANTTLDDRSMISEDCGKAPSADMSDNSSAVLDKEKNMNGNGNGNVVEEMDIDTPSDDATISTSPSNLPGKKRKLEDTEIGQDEKKFAYDICRSYFHPEMEHRYWCMWRIKTSDYLGNYPETKRGWEYFFNSVKEALTEKAALDTQSSVPFYTAFKYADDVVGKL